MTPLRRAGRQGVAGDRLILHIAEQVVDGQVEAPVLTSHPVLITKAAAQLDPAGGVGGAQQVDVGIAAAEVEDRKSVV